MSTLLITGGGGMVGRNLRAHPGIDRWKVVAPLRRELDLRDYDATLAFMRRVRPDVIVHAAGRVGGIHANLAAPAASLTENIDVGRNVVLAARAVGVPRLLNLASSSMYPRDAASPFAEDMVLKGEPDPTNEGYAIAKIVVTRLCQFIRREQRDLLYKTLIPCNLYGPYDKFDPRHSHLVPAILHKIHEAKASGADTVEVWGDGTARREFLYAGDLADAIVRAAADIDSLPDLMNIGVGHDHSINEYYATAAEVVGWSGTFRHDLSKPVGARQKLVDVTRQTEWGWSAKTSLRDGMAITYANYLEGRTQ